MNDVQFLRTPAGEELVVMSRSSYDALLAAADGDAEDAADARLFTERMSELTSGETQMLAAEVSALMLQGSSLLAAIRKWRGMTQLHVQHKTGIGQGYLSDLESGRRAGSNETLELLASKKCYDVPVSWLMVKATD